MLSFITTIMGAFIGMFATLYGGQRAYLREKEGQESFSSAILYNDLRSIERYLALERSSVNLRYSDDWQHMVANCPFLREEEIEIIYIIYDEVYNYNYRYKLKEKMGPVVKEDIDSYRKLQREMFDTSKGYIDFKKNSEKYEKLVKNLQQHMQR